MRRRHFIKGIVSSAATDLDRARVDVIVAGPFEAFQAAKQRPDPPRLRSQ
jgi:hypothetical protein